MQAAADYPRYSRAPRDEARPLRIIVADDDKDTVQMLSVILRDEGHSVYPAHSGKEVLPAVRLFSPDAVIIDVAIPGLSGYAVAQAIRHGYTDIRRPLVIAISGVWNETPDRIVGMQVGFDHHLMKPADPDEVLELLHPLRRRPIE